MPDGRKVAVATALDGALADGHVASPCALRAGPADAGLPRQTPHRVNPRTLAHGFRATIEQRSRTQQLTAHAGRACRDPRCSEPFVAAPSPENALREGSDARFHGSSAVREQWHGCPSLAGAVPPLDRIVFAARRACPHASPPPPSLVTTDLSGWQCPPPSTPSARGVAASGTGLRRMRRRSVSGLVPMPMCLATLAPASPPSSSPICRCSLASLSVRRPDGPTTPGSRSAKTRRWQD